MKVRQKQLPIPVGICMSCFNEQQQYSFPFLVYCPHSETLAVMRAADEHATFQCAPAQLENVLQQLQHGSPATLRLARAETGRARRRRTQNRPAQSEGPKV